MTKWSWVKERTCEKLWEHKLNLRFFHRYPLMTWKKSQHLSGRYVLTSARDVKEF